MPAAVDAAAAALHDPVASGTTKELASAPVLEGGRLVLLGARSRSGRSCVAARLARDGNETSFHCFDENDAVRVFLALGGRTGYHIDSESIVGIARPDVARVAIVGEQRRFRCGVSPASTGGSSSQGRSTAGATSPPPSQSPPA